MPPITEKLTQAQKRRNYALNHSEKLVPAKGPNRAARKRLGRAHLQPGHKGNTPPSESNKRPCRSADPEAGSSVSVEDWQPGGTCQSDDEADTSLPPSTYPDPSFSASVDNLQSTGYNPRHQPDSDYSSELLPLTKTSHESQLQPESGSGTLNHHRDLRLYPVTATQAPTAAVHRPMPLPHKDPPKQASNPSPNADGAPTAVVRRPILFPHKDPPKQASNSSRNADGAPALAEEIPGPSKNIPSGHIGARTANRVEKSPVVISARLESLIGPGPYLHPPALFFSVRSEEWSLLDIHTLYHDPPSRTPDTAQVPCADLDAPHPLSKKWVKGPVKNDQLSVEAELEVSLWLAGWETESTRSQFGRLDRTYCWFLRTFVGFSVPDVNAQFGCCPYKGCVKRNRQLKRSEFWGHINREHGMTALESQAMNPTKPYRRKHIPLVCRPAPPPVQPPITQRIRVVSLNYHRNHFLTIADTEQISFCRHSRIVTRADTDNRSNWHLDRGLAQMASKLELATEQYVRFSGSHYWNRDLVVLDHLDARRAPRRPFLTLPHFEEPSTVDYVNELFLHMYHQDSAVDMLVLGVDGFGVNSGLWIRFAEVFAPLPIHFIFLHHAMVEHVPLVGMIKMDGTDYHMYRYNLQTLREQLLGLGNPDPVYADLIRVHGLGYDGRTGIGDAQSRFGPAAMRGRNMRPTGWVPGALPRPR
ncbi:MAG: hypothetical protein Q9169_007708 [Polycauliona sp. 2 TL-2023]